MKKFTLLLLIVHLLNTSCSKDLSGKGGYKQVEMSFSLEPSDFGGVVTRAGVAVNENSVMNLWILQFDGTADDSKLIKAEFKASVSDLANMQLILNSGTGQRVVFIANTFDSVLFNEVNAPLNSYIYSQFKNKIISLPDEAGMFAGTTQKYLRMYGYYEGDIPNKSSSVVLYRICSKININYVSDDVSDVVDGVRLRITSLQLKNIPSTSSYISNPNNSVVNLPPSVNNYMITKGSATGQSGEAYSIGEYSGFVTYYIPENIAGVNNAVISQIFKAQYAPEKATYLEINGEGIGADGGLKEYVTFKFYLGNNLTNNYNVNANTEYNINIRFKGVNISDLRLEVRRVSGIEILEEEEIIW